MIDAKISRHAVMISGHAGYAPAGYDIVCEAVTALFCVTLDSIGKLTGRDMSGHIRSGHAELESTAADGTPEAVLFWNLKNGLRILAEQYPDNIRIQEV